jgi:phospholipase C
VLVSDGDSQPQPPDAPRLFETPEEMPLEPVTHTVVDVTPGALSKIEHIVVLMQENRSFDQVLGYLSRDGMVPRDQLLNGDPNASVVREPRQDHVEGLIPETNPPNPHPRDAMTFANHQYRSKRRTETGWPSYTLPGPYHGADSVGRQVADNMKGFVADYARHADRIQDRQLIMDYLTDAELPAYGALTREFAICDHWFCSFLGGTLPNRFISLTGDFSRDIYGSPEVTNPDLLGFYPLETPTFFDHLTKHGVQWKLFEHGYSMLRLIRNYTFDETNLASFDADFEAAVAAGLPPVTFIEPDYIETPTTISNDDHAPADMINGQRLIARIMKA